MKNSLFVLFALVFGVMTAAAQTPTPHYVVIDKAESEIVELEASNREMAGRNIDLEKENRLLDEDVAKSRDFIVQADEMIGRLSASAGEIYTLMQSVTDSDVRRELQQRMEDNRQSRYDLENRKRLENEAISRSEDQIENNRRMVAVNRVRTKANDQRVEYLKACIDLSIGENQDVDSVLNNADRVRREVKQFLNP